jgi:hypothetical protein
MKKSRFSEEKIISILREADVGVKVADLARKRCRQSHAGSSLEMIFDVLSSLTAAPTAAVVLVRVLLAAPAPAALLWMCDPDASVSGR